MTKTPSPLRAFIQDHLIAPLSILLVIPALIVGALILGAPLWLLVWLQDQVTKWQVL